MKATWKGQLLAESNDTIVIENNHYFPPSSIIKSFFAESDTTTICPWKGTASYYSIIVGNETNIDAAWYYPAPKEAAAEIKNYIAFWKGVEVSE
jgi:uncharacterized protein (DUF427 family)